MAVLRANHFTLEWVCTGDLSVNRGSEAYFWIKLQACGEFIVNPKLLRTSSHWGMASLPHGAFYAEDAIHAMEQLRASLSQRGTFSFWNHMDDEFEIDFVRDDLGTTLSIALRPALFDDQKGKFDGGEYDVRINLAPDRDDLERFFFDLLDEFAALDLTAEGRAAFEDTFGDLDRTARHVPWIGAAETRP